jgi:micrococcal nuclease
MSYRWKMVNEWVSGPANRAAGSLVAVSLITLASCSQAVPESPTPPESGGQAVHVVRVIDGDTIEVESGGDRETVRYIGIDATEVGSDGEPGECFSAEAAERNAELVLDVTVSLVSDTSDRDQFGRLLRYVFLPDGRLVNEVLAQEGYAGAADSLADTRYSAALRAANERAKDAGIGWWETCANAFPRSTSPRRPFECDPAYPTVCLPPAPPDLGCDDIPEREFIALHPDPHRLDDDGNGIACES